eukprot:3019805-Amphidinium_carterae.1
MTLSESRVVYVCLRFDGMFDLSHPLYAISDSHIGQEASEMSCIGELPGFGDGCNLFLRCML